MSCLSTKLLIIKKCKKTLKYWPQSNGHKIYLPSKKTFSSQRIPDKNFFKRYLDVIGLKWASFSSYLAWPIFDIKLYSIHWFTSPLQMQHHNLVLDNKNVNPITFQFFTNLSHRCSHNHTSNDFCFIAHMLCFTIISTFLALILPRRVHCFCFFCSSFLPFGWIHLQNLPDTIELHNED